MQRFHARAPVRTDPAGGGTDAPPFSVDHGGLVVNFAVQRHTFACVERLPKGHGVTLCSEDLNQRIHGSSVSQLPRGKLDLLQGFVRRLVPEDESILLITESDVPPGAGLGGSGALGVATVAALDLAFGHPRSPADAARLANEIERVDLGFPGGSQDSFAAALGGFNRIEYLKGGETLLHRIPVSDETRLELERNSLLIYTSEAHVSGNIHQDIKDSYGLKDSPTIKAMIELRESARRMAAALEQGDLAGYTREMNASCDSLYRLHPSCDSEAHRRFHQELGDCLVSRKTCGAGGGGFLLVHTRPGKRRECIRRAEKLGGLVWPVTIDLGGVRTWTEVLP